MNFGLCTNLLGTLFSSLPICYLIRYLYLTTHGAHNFKCVPSFTHVRNHDKSCHRENIRIIDIERELPDAANCNLNCLQKNSTK
jgi:hypothetical protein